jgi:hypothetical protein
MRSIRVIINPAKEGGRSISADLLRQQMAAAGMLIQERADVVNEAGYEDQGSGLRLFLDYDYTIRKSRWMSADDTCEQSGEE